MKTTKTSGKMPVSRAELETEISRAMEEFKVKVIIIRADKFSAVSGHKQNPKISLIYVGNEKYIYGPDPTNLDGIMSQNAIIENVEEGLHALGYSWNKERHRYQR